MYDGTIAEALAGTEMIRSGLSAIRRFMFCASTAGSKTEERTVTFAPCFSRPLLTELAQAAQKGFWFVQMMTPTFLPSSAPALPLAPIAPVTKTAASTPSTASGTQRVDLRHMVGLLSLLTMDPPDGRLLLSPPWGWTRREQAWLGGAANAYVCIQGGR
jgi:alkanesulfonate monooxygenase SsuD/methylene tetrahydromethanopterin reductase-like flavin-dependent oxidoreductase (luciferase family)